MKTYIESKMYSKSKMINKKCAVGHEVLVKIECVT